MTITKEKSMISKLAVLALIAATVSLQACYTRQYGRQLPLSDAAKNVMGCEDIEYEMARIRKFKDSVNNDGVNVSAVLTDLGVGNAVEKQAALDSADRRLEQLAQLKKTKNCA